jgi:CBS domain-containing protein
LAVQANGEEVRDAMTPEPRVADPSLSLAEAAQLMKSEDIGSPPVVQEGQLVAVLTDRDIVVRAVAESADPRATRVGDIASPAGELVEEISKPTGPTA